MYKPKLKIAMGMIIFEGDYVLRECLESVYPFAEQILIAEGPAKYWQIQGRTTSKDKTNEILHSFPDPDNKIIIHHGQYNEKDDQCNAYMQYLRNDIDYIWNLDSDEVFKQEDLKNFITLLEKEEYTSVGIKSCSFYGGFNRYIGGFEEAKDNFLRVFKVCPGAIWQTHRPPTIQYPYNLNIIKKHLDSDSLYDKIGMKMYHYSYVFPRQVYNKMNYYIGIGGGSNRISNYFWNVYWPWINAKTDEERLEIEKKYNGVHEYLPHGRPESFTKTFNDKHPLSIEKNMNNLKNKYKEQLEHVLSKL